MSKRLSSALRIGAIITGAFAALFGVAAGGVWWRLFRRPLPKTDGQIPVSGVDGQIEVARDRWGMPRVRAESNSDLWFGLGFCHGQDRLWQCDLYRRVSAGRLAELAGPDGIEMDRFMRTLGIRRAAEAEEAALDDATRAGLEAYAAGMNQAVAAAKDLPAELQLTRMTFEPWRPADSLAVGKLFAFGMSTNWERELLRADLVRHLGPERAAILDHTYPVGNPVVMRPGESFTGDGLALAEQIDRVREQIGLPAGATGSNNWAVAGKRSATGKPLVAGDPHLPSAMPGFIYQASLELGDRFCRGGTMPGMPTVFFGQNPDVCWTFTNEMADVQDLFVERITGDTYEFKGEQRPIEVIDEEIHVKGSESPVRHTIRATHHGPIVNDHLGADTGQPLALSWTALADQAICAAHLNVMQPTNGAELVAMLEPVAMPVVSLIWADAQSIGYKLIGRLPRRKGGCPDLPKPGWTGEYEWEGTVSYADQPELTNPDSGYLITANNMISEPGSDPHVTSDYLDGYRAARIEQLIKATPAHDLGSFSAMQTDLLSIPGLEVARRLVANPVPGQRERWAIERLRSWNGELGPDSIASTIYQAFILRLGKEFARAAIGDRDLAERYLDRADNGFLEHVTAPWRWHSHLLKLWGECDDELIGRPWSDLVASALRGALNDLENRFGPDSNDWRWGTIHELKFPHALGDANPVFGWVFNRGLKVGGGQETVTQVAYDPNNPFDAIWAPAWRMVADPSDPDRSRWQTFTGQSGHAQTEHYDDLQERWLAGETQAMIGEGPWEVLNLVPASTPPGRA